MELFRGSEAKAKAYAAGLKEFKKTLPPTTQIYSIVAPTAAEFSLPPRYKKLCDSQKDYIDMVHKQYQGEIKPINIYNALAQKPRESAYFKTDRNWTALGAYYAYAEFAKTIGFSPLLPEDYTQKNIPNFLGTHHALTKDKNLAQNPDNLYYYLIPGKYLCNLFEPGAKKPKQVPLIKESATGKDAYSVFSWGENPIMQIENRQVTGKRILVLGGSYKNAFAPFLVPHYQQVHILDSKHYKENIPKYIQQNQINEVLFIDDVM
jgi:hypothetical protein